MKKLIIIAAICFSFFNGFSQAKTINQLPAKTVGLDTVLIFVGNPTDGKLYKMSLVDLKTYTASGRSLSELGAQLPIYFPNDSTLGSHAGDSARNNAGVFELRKDGAFVPQFNFPSGGSPNSNIGSGNRLAVPNTNNIKTIFAGSGVTVDSTTNANALTFSVIGTGNDTVIVFHSDTIYANKKLVIPKKDTSTFVHAKAQLDYQPSDNHFYGDNGTKWLCLDCMTDTTAMHAELVQIISQQATNTANIALKLNISDTAAMLSHYYRDFSQPNDTTWALSKPNGDTTFLHVQAGCTITSFAKNGGGDSIILITSCGRYAVASSTGSGNTNSNIGSGYRLAVPNTNNIKTIHAGTNITMDSTSNANEITINSSGGSGSWPSGNYGNIPVTRNGVGVNPGSDSIGYTTSGGLVVKNSIAANSFISIVSGTNRNFKLYGNSGSDDFPSVSIIPLTGTNEPMSTAVYPLGLGISLGGGKDSLKTQFDAFGTIEGSGNAYWGAFKMTGVNGLTIITQHSGSGPQVPIYIDATGGESQATANLVLNTDGTVKVGSYKMPATSGTSGYVLTSNGTDASWQSPLWTVTGSDLYRNSKVFIGQTSGSAQVDILTSGTTAGISVGNSTSTRFGEIDIKNSSGEIFQFFKTGNSYSPYKIINTHDNGIFSASGSIDFLADDVAGNINFAAGAGSTAQLVVHNSGNVLIGTTTNTTGFKLQVSGNETANSYDMATVGTPAPASGHAWLWFDGTNVKLTKNVSGTTTTTSIF